MTALLEEIFAKLNPAEMEKDKRTYISVLFQNACSALSMGPNFYAKNQAANGTSTERLNAWTTAHRMVLHMIASGDFETISNIANEKGKEYPIDPYNPVNKEALIYACSFFDQAYTLFLAEQQKSRIVPVDRFLARVTESPADFDKDVYGAALASVKNFLDILQEPDFLKLATFMQSDEITGTLEALAARYICERYMQDYIDRLAEKSKSLDLGLIMLDMMKPE